MPVGISVPRAFVLFGASVRISDPRARSLPGGDGPDAPDGVPAPLEVYYTGCWVGRIRISFTLTLSGWVTA
jgi:hypothetical protein